MATEPKQLDESLEPDDRLTVVRAIQQYKQEAEQARDERIRKNRRNRDVYLGRQDWSHKQEGQSTEFLPKVPVSVEQMSAFVKRGLVQFGDWFSVDLDRTLGRMIEGHQVRTILKCYLHCLWERNNQTTNVETLISDAVKNGLLESLMIFKVHGGMMKTRTFSVEKAEPDIEDLFNEDGPPEASDEPQMEEDEEWRLRIDLVRPEDYYPDPTGNNLYEIHRVERDLHEVVEMAERGIYDMAMVKLLIDTDYKRPENEERRDEDRNQKQTIKPSFRKRVLLDEFWGTILHDDGTVAHRNVVATVANQKYLIRKPEPNPFWHQESPFVVAPLIRVPWSVWHKALYDHASDLNLAINELFNLMLDGGLAAVWGIKQLRLEDLEDPSQVSGGVRQGQTLAVKGTLPHGEKVLDTVATGDVPQDAMAIFEFVNREFTQAALTNELKLGALPPKQVRATEVIESSQSQAVMLDGVIGDLERNQIEPLLRKSFLTILQNADSIPPEALLSLADKRAALLIMRASPAERFALFAGKCSFKVNGLSSTMARAMDFQKIMAVLQSVQVNTMLFQHFLMKFSPDKVLKTILRTLNLNPDNLLRDPEEEEQTGDDMQRMEMVQQIMNPQQQGGEGGGLSAAGQGDGTAAQINQQANPRSGLIPNS